MNLNYRITLVVVTLCLCVGVAGCAAKFQLSERLQRLKELPLPQGVGSKKARQTAVEQPVTVIPLAGDLVTPRAELSGLAWYGDQLILLPQYPRRFGNQLYFLPRAEIQRFLRQESTAPLLPQALPLLNGAEAAQLAGFDGFEAIAFQGNQAFLTIEAEIDKQMVSYLLTGQMAEDLSGLTLDLQTVREIPPQTKINNIGEEALLLADDQVLTFYEANGFILNEQPLAHRFAQADLQPLGTLPFPTIEYRITDATPLDAEKRFWAINYFFIGDQRLRSLELGPDPLSVQYGLGPTHKVSKIVERLVEFQYSPEGITLVDQPPLQLQLVEGLARNWEGIVRLEEEDLTGFLLVSDTFPETILAFVPRGE